MTETKLNYTGQKKDDTGLLYYHARMYDPVLGRFVSPDSIVPGVSLNRTGLGAGVGQEDNPVLAVDFHETVFLESAKARNSQVLQEGFLFQLTGQSRQHAKEPWGPRNPQTLSRYTYALNNPVYYADSSGHKSCTSAPGCGGVVYNDSDYPVMVYAAYPPPPGACPGQAGCHTDDGGKSYYMLDWKELPPHTNSKQLGMYDVDMVRAYDDQHPISGVYDTSYEYKLYDVEQVRIAPGCSPTKCYDQVLGFGRKPDGDLFEWIAGLLAFPPFVDSRRLHGWKHCKERGCPAPYEYD